MNDKELMELAAKAAGLATVGEHLVTGTRHYILPDSWNPLTDDGDALRLAVKLQLTVCNEQVRAGVSYCTRYEHEDFPYIVSGVNEEEVIAADYAASRRAIVLAAAEIGKLRR